MKNMYINNLKSVVFERTIQRNIESELR